MLQSKSIYITKVRDQVKIKPHENQSVPQGIRRNTKFFENEKPNVTIIATLTASNNGL